MLPAWRRGTNLPKRGDDDGKSPLLGTTEKLVLIWSRVSIQLLGQNQPPLATGMAKERHWGHEVESLVRLELCLSSRPLTSEFCTCVFCMAASS